MYTFYWLTGNREVLKGRNPAACLNKAGYSSGALRALDFYAEGNNKDYVWDEKKRTWDKKTPAVETDREN